MDILNILEQLKQKGLDVVQVELLKSAYELQARNLQQLKENNEALRESNQLLKEKIVVLEKEKENLAHKIKNIPVRIEYEITDIAKEVLKQCINADETKFNSEDIIDLLPSYKRIQIETAIGELSQKKFIVQAFTVGYGKGVEYKLTQYGREFCSSLID